MDVSIEKRSFDSLFYGFVPDDMKGRAFLRVFLFLFRQSATAPLRRGARCRSVHGLIAAWSVAARSLAAVGDAA